ncbi:MAG TPA: ribosomal protein S18-alanine N-acetyltransferase [Terriglobia bacterium]|nr:ribosomal protein S18-alanine N-acetyltransferase [Terriglobia bacterium]
MDIRRFTPGDLPSIIQIQRQVLPVGGWTENDYLRFWQQPGGLALLAETGEGPLRRVVGFAVALRTAGEAEILTLAVESTQQRQGIGRQLLLAICCELTVLGVRRVYLEVRVSNQAAFNLYASAGFVLTYVRKNYYVQPDEDAYVMSLDLTCPGFSKEGPCVEPSKTAY